MNHGIAPLVRRRLFGLLSLLLLALCIDHALGETSSWFLFGLDLLEWTAPGAPDFPGVANANTVGPWVITWLRDGLHSLAGWVFSLR